jgi:NADH:ubiquinone oxidoreductase subunit C
MDQQSLQAKIQTLLPEAEFLENKQYVDFIVPEEKMLKACKLLTENDELALDYLISLTAVDWKTHFMVVYHINSSRHNHTVVMKVKADRENPVVNTVCKVWPTAEFHERETFDMFGIHFRNHPDMRRIFLDETDIIGYPLRKDFVDDINIIQR